MKGSEWASCDISKGNIHFMDSKDYDFIIMVKGMKNLVREVVMSVQGTFEQSRSTSIRAFEVNGITVQHQLFSSDEHEGYFHVFYDEGKHLAERKKLEQDIDLMSKQLKSWQGMQVRPNGKYAVEHQIIIIGDALVTSDCFLKK